jgi:3-hydroxyacyl-[acyl-carrier-protein] dehydratase
VSELKIEEILGYLPHRYPFLLLDRVLHCEPGERVLALKNVTINEPFFNGHFPGRPVMPGVLLLEAMAQATAILAFRTAQNTYGSGVIYYLVSIDKARFKRPVVPGDQLRLHATFQRRMRHMWKFSAWAEVEEQRVCEAEIMCMAKQDEA